MELSKIVEWAAVAVPVEGGLVCDATGDWSFLGGGGLQQGGEDGVED